jgi:ubiquinone/menaquinone biosynthesis C-methylase UbiE
MAESRIDFNDASAYERFMGRWSRAVAPHFLRWIAPRRRARWLDVGCGTGILAEALLDSCEPASVVGIDVSAEQIGQVSRKLAGARAKFQQADATALPFRHACFDIAASALVLNFVADPLRALEEMRRVTAPGGMVANYVWDFGNELSPSGPMRRAMRAFGADVPVIPGTAHSSLDALRSLYLRAGLQSVESTTIDVALSYTDFEDFWTAQTPSHIPTTNVINVLTTRKRRLLKRAVYRALSVGPNGRIDYAARANMVRGTVPAQAV